MIRKDHNHIISALTNGQKNATKFHSRLIIVKFVFHMRRILTWTLLLLTGLIIQVSDAAEPTVQASNIRANNVSCISARITWLAGNGSWRIVVMREASAVNWSPTDGQSYANSNVFGNPVSRQNTDNYIVYNSTGTSVTVSGLKPNTKYFISVFEHDGFNDYLLPGATDTFRTQFLNLDFSFSYLDSCQNSNVVSFKNKSTTNIPGLTFTWDFKDGDTKNGVDVTHTYKKAGFFAVELRATPNGGCPNTYVSNKSFFIVPRPTSTIFVDDSIQCFTGHEFNFWETATLPVLPGQLGVSRYWKFTDGDSITLPSFKKFFNQPGLKRVDYVSYTRYNNNPTNCADTAMMYVRLQADPSSGVQVSDTLRCFKGNVFTFDNTLPNLASFVWRFGDGNSSTQKQVSHSYASPGIYQVEHEASTSEGCSSKDTFEVEVKPSFDSDFSGLPGAICESKNPLTMTPNTPGGLFLGYKVSGNQFTPDYPAVYNVKYSIRDEYCPDSTEKTIVVNPLPRFSLGKDTNLCGGNPLNLSINIAADQYEWNNGSTGNTLLVTQPGLWWGKATKDGCSWSDTISLYLGTAPQVQLPSDTLVCKGAVIRLKVYWPLSKYSWGNGSTDSVFYITGPGTYNVTISNPCGNASDAITVNYQNDYCDILVPTAFSPNGDGLNEKFTIIGRDITPKQFKIYDRWGAKVFDSEEAGTFEWDGFTKGAVCMGGFYSWTFQYEVITGGFIRRFNTNGSVYLMR